MNNMKLKIKVFLIIYLLYYSYLFSAIPLTTEDTGLIEVGKYEVETSYEIIPQEINFRQGFNFTLKSGLTEKIDIGVSFPYQTHPYIEEKFGEASLSLKFLILENLLGFTLSNKLGSSSYFLNFIFSKNINKLNLHFNFGYNVSEDRNLSGEVFYSSAFEYDIKKFCFVGELLGDACGFNSYLLGIRYKFNENHFFTFGFEDLFKDETQRFIFGFNNKF